jgi:NAD+ kinase
VANGDETGRSADLNIGVFTRTDRPDFRPKLVGIIEWLESRGCRVVVEETAARLFDLQGATSASREVLPGAVDLAIVFGGDGTLLSAARLVEFGRTPILGVNLGSLGFLTAVALDELYAALERILAGQHRIERRSLLRAELHPLEGPRRVFHALNDVVLSRGAQGRIICINAFINDEFMAAFLADGMIISSPTGSTAYSLSAGGPIMYPTLKAIVLTPICPHTLTHRPLVIPAEGRIRMVLTAGDDVTLAVDGQVGAPLQEGDGVVCTESDHEVELVLPSDRSFFDVLRQKLKWGERWHNQ